MALAPQQRTYTPEPPRAVPTPPPSIDERIVDAAPPFDEDESVVAAVRALKLGREAAAACHTLASTILSDSTLTEHGRQLTAADKIHARSIRATEQIQHVIERIDKKIKEAEAFLVGPPAALSPAAIIVQSEARQALLRLPAQERRRIVLAAIDAGDPVVTGAVLRASSFMFGSNDVEQMDFRLRWQAKFHTDKVARLEALRGALEHLERGGNLLVSYVTGLTDAHVVAQARQRQATTSKAVADAA